jgi:multidrug efflux pump subunit AcrB
VPVANALLFGTNAEKLRTQYQDPFRAAIQSGCIRLRPIMMTSIAMIVAMILMATGLGGGGTILRRWAGL